MVFEMQFDDGGSVSSTKEAAKRALYRTSPALFYGSLTAFVGGVMLIMSYASPYWLASWDDTLSPFENMGLWEFCFFRFRHPDYQFDHLFDGCHALFGDEYRLIREKLLPGWLMVVQLFATLALIVAFSGQILGIVLLLRYPLEISLRFEYHFSGVVSVCYGLASIFMLLCVIIFGFCCWERDWLLYPNYNYLSWSFVLACLTVPAFAAAAGMLATDYKRAKEAKERNKALIRQMAPPTFDLPQYHHHGAPGSGFI